MYILSLKYKEDRMVFWCYLLSFGLPMVLLYNRHIHWLTGRAKFIITVPLKIVSLIIAVFFDESGSYNLLCFSLVVPIIAQIFELIATQISERIIGRDFMLWLKNSKYVNHPEIRLSDKLISFSLLIINILVCFLLLLRFGGN